VYNNSIGKLIHFQLYGIYVNKRGFVWVRNCEKYSNCVCSGSLCSGEKLKLA